ncbi:MAG TPA: ATP-binding protein [Desulfobacteraceae bacterium]|nr:ATP-binding protein [Desulfobacteraceae bacterium]
MSKIKLPATIGHLERLVGFVSDCAKNTGFSDNRIREIELATEEALVNIFNYAYPDGPGDLEVSCTPQQNAFLKIEIMDNGMPFDPLSLPDPDLQADISERKVGGLGIFFMRKMADELQYRREKGCNILTFIFLMKKAD